MTLATIGTMYPTEDNRFNSLFEVATFTDYGDSYTGTKTNGVDYNCDKRYWKFVPNGKVPEAPSYQQQAISVFSAMLDAAKAYRAGQDRGRLHSGYGICDNIDRFTDTFNASPTRMSHVKDNLIRTLPSYSGAYHYPVKGDGDRSPEQGWECNADKWAGEYGANRVQQLEELVEAIKTRWNDELTTRMSPARRMGYKIGDTFRDIEDNCFYTLVYDDDSSSPGFAPFGKGEDESRWRDLEKMVKVDMEKMAPKMSVARYLAKMEKIEAAKAKAKALLDEQQKLIDQLTAEFTLAEFGLRHYHGVKRA